MLEAKARLLSEKGLSKITNKTNSLARLEEDILWECGQLGDKTPKSIIATLWWQLTQHFGLQGRQEHYSMRVEDFPFRKDETKGIVHSLRRGYNKNKAKRPTPKKYLSKRPVGMEKSGPLYLQPIVNPLTNIWYKKTPMGIISINPMMKDLISNSPLQNSEKHLANHSAKKTLVKKLKQQQVPKSEIISITGHNREAGLDAYDSGDQVQQKQLSHFISRQPSADCIQK